MTKKKEDLDIFEDQPVAAPAGVLEGSPVNMASPQKPKEITDLQRYIFQNIFDTDTNGRKQYLKELGYTFDPEDKTLNRFKPIGSAGGYNMEIDPGIVDTWRKGGLWAAAKETGKDVTDLSIDIAKGVSVGALGTLGTTAGGLPGFLLAAAGGSAAVEAMKTAARDMILDKDVPVDMKEKAVVTMFDTLGPKIAQGVLKQGAKGVKTVVDGYRGALKYWAKNSGSGLTDEAVEAIAANPAKFAPEKVKGATAQLGEKFREMFGIRPGEAVPDSPTFGSQFQRMLSPIKEAQVKEIDKLSKIPQASFTTQELLEPIDKIVRQLQSKADLTTQEEAALNYFKLKADKIKSIGLKNFADRTGVDLDAAQVQVKGLFNKGFQAADEIVGYQSKDPITGKITTISPVEFEKFTQGGSQSIASTFEPIKATRISGPQSQGSFTQAVTPGNFDVISGQSKLPTPQDIANETINFKQVKEVLESVQHDAWDREVPGSQAIKQVFGGNKEQINGLLKAKANSVGSKFTELTEDLHKKLDVYKRAAPVLKPDNMIQAFADTGKITPKKAEIGLLSDELDANFGSNFSKAFKDGTMSSMVENAFRTSTAPKGSEKMFRAAINAFNVTTGGPLGALQTAAMADPRVAQAKLMQNLTQSEGLQSLINKLSSPGQLPITTPMGAIEQAGASLFRQQAVPAAGAMLGQSAPQTAPTAQAAPIKKPLAPDSLDIFEE